MPVPAPMSSRVAEPTPRARRHLGGNPVGSAMSLLELVHTRAAEERVAAAAEPGCGDVIAPSVQHHWYAGSSGNERPHAGHANRSSSCVGASPQAGQARRRGAPEVSG